LFSCFNLNKPTTFPRDYQFPLQFWFCSYKHFQWHGSIDLFQPILGLSPGTEAYEVLKKASFQLSTIIFDNCNLDINSSNIFAIFSLKKLEIRNCNQITLHPGALQFPLSDEIEVFIHKVKNPFVLPEEAFGPQVLFISSNIFFNNFFVSIRKIKIISNQFNVEFKVFY
jgi:hypothetical protein